MIYVAQPVAKKPVHFGPANLSDRHEILSKFLGHIKKQTTLALIQELTTTS